MEITEQEVRYHLGCIQDTLDTRDHYYSPNTARLRQLPSEVNLQNFPVYDQGRIGSCTANALAGAVGDNGYFFIPYDYLMSPDLAWDFWIICGIKH